MGYRLLRHAWAIYPVYFWVCVQRSSTTSVILFRSLFKVTFKTSCRPRCLYCAYDCLDSLSHLYSLRAAVNALRPVTTWTSSTCEMCRHQGLPKATCVFIRRDTLCRTLQSLFGRLFPVISRPMRLHAEQLPVRQHKISIDCLNPTFLVVFLVLHVLHTNFFVVTGTQTQSLIL